MNSTPIKLLLLPVLLLGAGSMAVGQIYFGSEKIISNVCGSASSVFACDIDGDGDIDVLAAAAVENKIVWYRNDGTGNFGPQQVITTQARTAVDVFACDMDGDLDMDVLSASFGDDKIAWYENDGSGNFGEQQVISDSAYGAQSVYACDIDGDLDMDVLSASKTDQKIVLYKNNGSEIFDNQLTLSDSSENAYSVLAFDLEQDADPDVLCPSNGDHKIGIFVNDGLGYFDSGPAIEANDVRSVFACDVDGDGDVDILAGDFSWGEISWYENYDNDHFSSARVITSSASGVLDVYAVDLDKDLDNDVISASYHDNKIAWYENDGSGNFVSQQVVSAAAIHANSIYASDIDGDGDPDLLSASSGDHKIAWYENSPPPEITVQPASQSGCVNSDIHIRLSANFADSYQWQADAGSGFTDLNENSVYSGVSTDDLMISGATADLSGTTYRCIAANPEGETTSESATLTIYSAAEITSHPAPSTVVCQGATDITLEVHASGAISYQWYFEGDEIADAINSTLAIKSDPGNSGNYYCMLQCGSIQSDDATVLIQPATTVTTSPPANTVACEGSEEIELGIEATGTEPVTYQWIYDGETISGETNATIQISTSTANSGTYSCEVTGECGIDISDNAAILIQSATTITSQPPQDITVCEGGAEIQLQVEASGTGTITYQWNYNDAEITGEINSTINITADPENSGSYNCTITGECGMITSEDTEVNIPPAYFITESELICSGSDFTFPDNTTQTNITSQIIYTSQLQAVSGCDSMIETTLEIHDVDNSVAEEDFTLIAGNGSALSYQWIDCQNSNAPVSEATNREFAPATDGEYAVIINDGICIDTSLCYTVVGIGMDNNPAHRFALYPNPTKGIINIEGAYIHKIELKNISGQSFMLLDVNNDHVMIDLGSQNSGLYLIEITTDTDVVMRKIHVL